MSRLCSCIVLLCSGAIVLTPIDFSAADDGEADQRGVEPGKREQIESKRAVGSLGVSQEPIHRAKDFVSQLRRDDPRSVAAAIRARDSHPRTEVVKLAREIERLRSEVERLSDAMAEVFNATNGLSERGLWSCSARATSSLPVPDSPVMSTVMLEPARRPIERKTSCMAGA